MQDEIKLLSPSELADWQRGIETAELIESLLASGCTNPEIHAVLSERKRSVDFSVTRGVTS
jgi:hypothetical protein